MARTPNKPKPGRNARITMIIPGELAELVDRLAVKLAAPGTTLSRSDVIRMALYSFVKK